MYCQHSPLWQRTQDSTQKHKLKVFHWRCLCKILGIKWEEEATNNEALSRVGIPSMSRLLFQHRLHCLNHVRRMDDGHIPKDLLYGELASGYQGVGCPQLHNKNVCKRDIKACYIDTIYWEVIAGNRILWKHQVLCAFKVGEPVMPDTAEVYRARRKVSHQNKEVTFSESHGAYAFMWQGCNRLCKSMIGHYSHTGGCSSANSIRATPYSARPTSQQPRYQQVNNH